MKIKYLKHLFSGLFSIAIALPFSAHALSVGKMQLKSAYGQPLHATISIPAYTSAEIESLTVSLAKQSAFGDAGLDWLAWYSQLSMTLRYDTNSKPYIAIRTTNPVDELTLSLIIEFNWRGGRTVKQFDALLSPTLPSTSSKTTPSVQQKPSAENKIVLHEGIAPRPTEFKREPMRPKAVVKDLGNGRYSYGPVLPGQSLSSVAEKFASVTKMDINQRMQILFNLNPQAFARDDLGSLKAGYSLRFSNDFDEIIQTTQMRPNKNIEVEEQIMPPPYEENVDSIQQFGQVVRLEKEQEDQPPSEAELLQQRLLKTRKDVEEYRKTNEGLRTRLVELEEQLKLQADQLGIIEPDPVIPEVNGQTPAQTSLVQ